MIFSPQIDGGVLLGMVDMLHGSLNTFVVFFTYLNVLILRTCVL